MKRLGWMVLGCVLSMGVAWAQGTAPAQTAMAASPGMPTMQEVDAFLQRMYGWSPDLRWKIVSIKPAIDPQFAEVVFYMGAEPRATHLFIPRGGKYAIAGNMFAFGADPFADTRAKLAKSTTGMVRGTKDAKLTMVVFSDLECPHCKRGEPIVEQLLVDMPGSKLVFQQFPLEQIHPWSLTAAKYSDCVGRIAPAKAFPFNDEVFAQQEQITAANAAEKLNAIAKGKGVDAAMLSACVEQPETAERIQQSLDLGTSVGVNGTPTLFINGRMLSGIEDVPYEQLKQVAEFEAKQTR